MRDAETAKGRGVVIGGEKVGREETRGAIERWEGEEESEEEYEQGVWECVGVEEGV